MRQSMLISGIGQRLLSDMTYGTLSSDGRRVFSIEDLELAYGPSGNNLLRIGQRVVGRNLVRLNVANGEQTALCNRLAAYEISTGKLLWSIGGPAGKDALQLAETFFLGPPLPLMGHLYVLGEVQGEIRLMALETATGELLWSQQLAVVEQSVDQDPLRRVSGVSPSYADGILVCPTSSGAIVGVELSTRSLLWGYRYRQGANHRRPNNMLIASVASNNAANSRWVDGAVSIADGRVLATPLESDLLYCLSLIDGKELWRAARQNDLYAACADREKVVLVGSHGVRALQMSNGHPAWGGHTVELPDDSTPSGRGFRVDGRYFLPLSTAEVVAIDLEKGEIVEAVKSRNGAVPGNLVCYRGMLISQGFKGVEAFYQIDAVRNEVERRLAADPADAGALVLRGETLLEAGKRTEAVAALRRAYTLQSNPRTRKLLRDALLEGLQQEFGAYREYSDEVERLLDDTAERAVYFRRMANGLRQAGQWTPALEYYEKIINLEPDRRPLDAIDKNYSVRRDRWFQSQLALLRNEAQDDTAAKIDAMVETQLEAALADGSIDRLQRFLDYFDNQPNAETARKKLVGRLRDAGRLLEAELAATADVLVKEKPAQPETTWPVGKVVAKIIKTKDQMNRGYGRHVVEMRGDPGPYLAETSIGFDNNRYMLTADDGLGRKQWQISLAAEGQRQNFAYNRAWTYAQAENHLLLVVLGWKVMAIDTLRSGNNATPRLLWTHDLMSSSVDPLENDAMFFAMPNQPWRWQQRFGHISSQSSLLGPVSNRSICFQRLRNLVAVDPWSGEMLWVRQDVPPGSDLFGDDEYLFVLSPELEEAMLLRTADGALLGTRKVPRLMDRKRLPNGERKRTYAHLENYCLATLGRQLLLWWPEGNQRVLTLVDPLDGRDIWPGQMFPANAHTCVLSDRLVGVMQPDDGRFMLKSLPDGQTLIDVKLEPEPTLIDITLLADDDQYYLLTRGSIGRGISPKHIQSLPNCDPKPIIQGRLYAFDKQGKLRWPRPAIIESQFLLLNQPARLPLLSFACQTYEQDRDGTSRQIMSLMSIDKRNGRVAYKAAFTNNIGLLDVVGHVENNTVDLVTQQKTVRLTFTDQPLPPISDTEYQPAHALPESGGLHGLWRSAEKMLGRILDDLRKKGE